jgi:RimJ/RimL family protein N-acetyltransferase
MNIDLQPTLVGELLELRPLKPEDWDALFAVASDPLIWEQHPAWDRYKEEVFRGFFQGALDSKGAFVVIDKATREIIGSTRYFGYEPENSEIEIGWTFLARKYWGGNYNKEMKQMLLDHAFKFVSTAAFYVGENNLRSRKAMEKIGGVNVGMVKRNLPGSAPQNVKYVIKRSD